MFKTRRNSGRNSGYFTGILDKLLPARKIDAVVPECFTDVVANHEDVSLVAKDKQAPSVVLSYLPDEVWVIIILALRRLLVNSSPLNWIKEYIATLQNLAKVNKQLASLVNTRFTGKDNYIQYIQNKTLIPGYNLENSSIYLELVELLILGMKKPPNKNDTKVLFYLAVRLRALTGTQQETARVFVNNNFQQAAHFLLNILHKYQDKKIEPFHFELCSLLQLLASNTILLEQGVITFNEISEFIGEFDTKTNPSLMDLKVINNLLLSLSQCQSSIPKNIIGTVTKQLEKVEEINPQLRADKYINIIHQTVTDLKSTPAMALNPAPTSCKLLRVAADPVVTLVVHSRIQ